MNKKTGVIAACLCLASAVLFAQEDVVHWDFSFYPYSDEGSTCQIENTSVTQNGANNQGVLIKGRINKKIQYPYAGASVESNTPATVSRVQQVKGVEFWCMSTKRNQEYLFAVKQSTVTDDDQYVKSFRATTTPTKITILWSTLKQQGWGAPKPFVRSNVTGDFLIQTKDNTKAYDYDISIWGLKFID